MSLTSIFAGGRIGGEWMTQMDRSLVEIDTVFV